MKILFPVVRFTEVSSILAPFVKNMARLCNAQIHVLTVEPPIDQFIEMRIKEASEWIEEFISRNLSDYPASRVEVVPGDPAEKILEYIDKHGMDFVIIGTHGRTGLSGLLFGSVAKDIVAKSPIPVLTINPFKLNESYLNRNAECIDKLLSCR